jgi:hypothetical protein
MLFALSPGFFPRSSLNNPSLVSFLLTSAALTQATSKPRVKSWGTASMLIVPFTSTTFDAKGLLTVAFLANAPQVFLSLVYFSVNRLCTSRCFANEWNNYVTHRKGLRVTAPTGKQRSTHFLQLPYRWDVPLTVTVGLLHWLLSQSLFLVRREMRRRDGSLYPGSTYACGYSVSSILVFSLAFFTLTVLVLWLLLKRVELYIPPARQCSLVISAACHPPEDDIDAQLEEVQWGVTEEGTDHEAGHCTFTSGDVMTPQAGLLYK